MTITNEDIHRVLGYCNHKGYVGYEHGADNISQDYEILKFCCSAGILKFVNNEFDKDGHGGWRSIYKLTDKGCRIMKAKN